ncbi:MAG: glutamine synthetase beta-grasp domain-containing protein [Oligoflexales bacterium]
MNKISAVEYIWLDGVQPTQALRSKCRILPYKESMNVADLPEWSFDGSSTQQAEGDDSDCLLKPVTLVRDPVRGNDHYLVMCEVANPDGSDHSSNTRASLRKAMEEGGVDHDPYIGFEQEYTLFKDHRPLGWPKEGYPAPQGPFYCGVGAKNVFGRSLVEEHMKLCNEAGLCFYGINAEVMPGQWEFQIGYRGLPGEKVDPLTVSDHVWIARYLMCYLGEQYGVEISFDNKPVKGDWNGAGMHTNFSTKNMRDPAKGQHTIEMAIQHLSQKHTDHIEAYGDGLAERLTGEHETCSIKDFRAGASDRGASIRIPVTTASKGYGYIEDRRPGANADPYRVAEKLVKTICLAD